MMPDVAIFVVALTALALAAVPWLWVWRQRGPRRNRSRDGSMEGRIDGLLLLATLLLTLFAGVMSAVAMVRAVRERQELRHARPVAVRIDQCWVTQQRTGGRTADRASQLTCDVTHDVAGTSRRDTVHAGFPGRGQAYDDWVRAHPPGSAITLWQTTQAPHRLVGFEQIVPSTRTAAHAAGRALGFSLAALLAFLASRLFVRMRRN